MKKRSCNRFTIPGTTLYYKSKPRLFKKQNYSENYYPVINLSKGGANFLCDERLKAGTNIIVKINVPGASQHPEIIASVRWISKNPEQSYKYQTGIEFNAYGTGRNENPASVLTLLENLEQSGFNKG